MPRLPVSLLRKYPAARLLTFAWIVLTRLREDLSPEDRRRLAEVLRRRGRDPRGITAQERQEVIGVLRKLDARRALAEAVAAQVPGGRFLRRHR